MYKVTRKSDALVRHIATNKIALNYITKDVSPGMSLAVTKATGYREKETAEYDRIYFVLSGELELIFRDSNVALVAQDCCYVAKGTAYEMQGTFEVIVINQPAFGL